MTNDEAKELVSKHASELAEHFDGSVRIFVTWSDENENGLTHSYDAGRGNWFAAYGHIHQWLIAEAADVHKRVQNDDGP